MPTRPYAGWKGLSPDSSVEADEIVEAWLTTLPREGGGRPAEVVDQYRVLARAIVRHGLRPISDDALRVDLSEQIPDMDRALGGVAAASRKAGLSISSTLEDLGGLVPATVRWLDENLSLSSDETVVVRAMASVVLALERVSRRLVRLLELSAHRAQREHAEALASMTDVVSHELRNRLGAARTASQMLVNPQVSLDEDGVRRAVELVRSSVDAALHTLDDVRALITREVDSNESARRTMPLPNLVRAVIEEVRARAVEAGVTVDVEGDLVECQVDAHRLRLIVYNLVWNGIKYSDSDEERPTVTVGTRLREDASVQLTVRDNGIGIPAEELDDVFTFRVRGSEGEDRPGSGLGLAIVREAAEQIGGEISVESELGVGTTFTVAFAPVG